MLTYVHNDADATDDADNADDTDNYNRLIGIAQLMASSCAKNRNVSISL